MASKVCSVSIAILVLLLIAAPPQSFAELGACKTSNFSQISASATVINNGNLIQSDGLGDYVDGKQYAQVVLYYALNVFPFRSTKPNATPTRSLVVDLNHPVAGGGGSPLGVIKTRSGIHTYWYLDSNKLVHSVQEIPVGTTFYSDLTAVFVTNPADGKVYIIQMGPWSWDVCENSGPVSTAGSTRAIVTRTGMKTWSTSAPSGSIGMVSDITNPANPIPVGLYYTSFMIHYAELKPRP